MLRQKIRKLYCSCKMDIYKIKFTHYKYNCSQPCLTLLMNCILLARDNYNIISVQL
jgi:hypothetical protein